MLSFRKYASNVHPSDIPPVFIEALQSLRAVKISSALHAIEISAPTGLAQYSAALRLSSKEMLQETPITTSTLVFLYDQGQESAWGADFRVVGHLSSQIDKQMGDDPILNELLWADLQSNLDQYAKGATSILGTVTKEVSQTFGGLELDKSAVNMSLRCSWTPGNIPNIGLDLYAWCHLILATAGMHNELPFGLEISEG